MPEHFEVKRIADYLKDHGLLGQRLIKSKFKNKGERILKNDLSFTKFDGARLYDIKVKAKYTGFEFDWEQLSCIIVLLVFHTFAASPMVIAYKLFFQ